MVPKLKLDEPIADSALNYRQQANQHPYNRHEKPAIPRGKAAGKGKIDVRTDPRCRGLEWRTRVYSKGKWMAAGRSYLL